MDEKGAVKQTILDKALELFSAKGYEGVSVSELAEAAGITKPTLYYYFGSKEGMFEAVCQSNYTRLNTLITENAVYSPNPKSYFEDIFLTLTKVSAAYFSFAKENDDFYRIVLANLSMPSSSAVFEIVKKFHFTQFEVIESMFRSMAKAHGNLRGKSKTLTWSFIGTINSYISLYLSGGAGQEMNKKNVKELVHQFMHGIYS
ncbi:MAG: TetR/AcrR family transcriptional regulator [Treponema sp.]|jgi:TetR/AcrR family transcriptional regulator|nr:TetR/AcrR family transcriptional regulator [Treponema sp.]